MEKKSMEGVLDRLWLTYRESKKKKKKEFFGLKIEINYRNKEITSKTNLEEDERRKGENESKEKNGLKINRRNEKEKQYQLTLKKTGGKKTAMV